jgi:hypothetical protein
MTLVGQTPPGAGMMSAPCRWWAARDVPETVIFRYGRCADLVRWQMVVFAEAPVFADVLLGPVGPAWANVADNASEPAAAAKMAMVFFTSRKPP